MSSSNFVYSSWNFFPGAIQLAECEALQLDTVFVCKLCLLPFAILRCYFGSFRCSLALPFNVSGIRFPPCQPRSLQKKHICQSVGLYEQKKWCQSFPAGSHYLLIILAFIMKQRGIKKPAKRTEEQYRYVLWPARNWAAKMDQTETNVIKVDSII